jgi:hypothetical protein
MNIRALVILFAVATTVLAQAQDIKQLQSRSLIKLSPQHFGVNTLQVGTERFNASFTKSWSIAIGFRNQGGNNDYDRKIRGGDLDLQFRKYVRPMQHLTSRKNRSYVQGIYFGPFVNAGMYSIDEQYTSNWINYNPMGQPIQQTQTFGAIYDTRHMAGGFTIGVQRTFWEVLAVDIFVGGGLRSTAIDVISNSDNRSIYSSVVDPSFSGIFPRIGAKLAISL